MSLDQAASAFAFETFVGWRKKPPESRFLRIDVRELIYTNKETVTCIKSSAPAASQNIWSL